MQELMGPDLPLMATGNSLGSDWRPILLAGEDRHHNFTLAEPPFPD